MISPQKAFGRALVSVCGHLYGADMFDELKGLYIYVLKLTIVIAIVSAVAFFFVRIMDLLCFPLLVLKRRYST